MAVLREIITDWAGNGVQSNTVMFFRADQPVADQRTALKAYWDGVKTVVSNQYSFTIRQEGRELNDGDGSLSGAWAVGTSLAGTGTDNSQPVPEAAQALCRWATGVVVAGRFLKGRTYIPGIAQGYSQQGQVLATARTAIKTAGDNLAASATGFVIWHRPAPGGDNGQSAAVTSSSVWQEWAVQRRRRS